MPRRRVRTGSLRRRLAFAFVLVAGLSAGALAAGSFFLVRETRLQDSLSRAKVEAIVDLSLAGNSRFLLDQPPPEDFNVVQYEERGVHAILIVGAEAFPSDPRFDPLIPQGVRDLVAEGKLAYQRVSILGQPFLLVGGHAPNSDGDLYLLFSEQSLEGDLDQLRNVLFVGWLAVVLVAGLVGRLLARTTLEPVARASRAAHSMAEGLLETRLPVGAADEFGAWAASFNEMADALEAKITALSEAQARERRFTSDVAHELRTPLAALVGEASLLREHLERMPDEARRPAELLIQDVGRLRRLVDELMEISRLDSGRENVQVEEVDLLALAGAALRARGWDSRVDLAGEEVVLLSDRRRLERIISNLTGNALEHGGRGVRVRIGRDGTRAFVEVTDGGPGIPPEHLSHLFERFYKADASRTGVGSGLGLAIARENARLLAGDIDVWSEIGVGSRFTLRLPVTGQLPGSEERVSAEADHESHNPTKGGSS
jgi:signal transduction histidine kinase